MVTLLYADNTQVLELDASLSVTHLAETDVTEHPVEEGLPTADSARLRPRDVSIEGLVSDTPLGERERQEAAAAGDARPRSQGALQALLELRRSRELITVVTDTVVYPDMILASLSWPEDANLGEAFRFSGRFRQVRIVELRTVELAAYDRANGRVNKGKQVTTELRNASEQNKSVLASGYDRLAGK